MLSYSCPVFTADQLCHLFCAESRRSLRICVSNVPESHYQLVQRDMAGHFLILGIMVCCCCCCIALVVSNSVRPHRRQPTRLPRPWDSPGKNTGVGCHFLLQCMKVKSESAVAQSCLTLATPWIIAY